MKESNANTIDDTLISQNDIDQLIKGAAELVSPAGSGDVVESTPDANTQSAQRKTNKDSNNTKPQKKGGSDSSLEQVKGSQSTDPHNDGLEKAGKNTATEENESSLVSQDDLDGLLDDISDNGHTEVGAAPDRIILEEPDEEASDKEKRAEPASSVKSSDKLPVKRRKKHAIIILVIAGISMFVVGGWVILELLNRSHEPEAQSVQRFQIVNPKAAKPMAPSVVPKPMTDDNMVKFEEFVVFAPPEKPGITFLRLNISLAMKDPAFARRLKAKQAFYRSIIYNRLNDVVTVKPVKEIEPRRIKELLEDALRPSLPAKALKKIMFTKFIVT